MQSFNSLVTIRDYFHLFFLLLYFCIPYLGPIGAFDVVGSQWLAISLLNFILLTFFCILKYPVGEIVNNYLFLIIILFMLWAAYSLTYTINFSEGIIVYARLINTFVAAINISLLLKNRTNIINLFAFILIVLLIGEGLYVFKCFIINPQKLSLDSLILSIKGNSGNKNIFAAAVLFKIPFSIFLYYQKQRRLNYIALFSFFLGVSSVFVMNTRSTYIGLLLIIFFALTYSMFNNKVKGFVILVLTIISFLFSNFLLKSKVENFNQQISNYGTTISRIKTINFSQSGRSEIWLDGLYSIKDNPITGCGIGNWKILSAIKTHGIEMYKSDWLVPYHIHNDFIEMCVELGLIGGILFVFIFVFLFFIFIKNNLITHVLESRLLLLLLLSCFFCYCIDSFLNFPLERPAMQLNFAFLIAMGFLYSPIRVITKFPLRIFFLFFMFLILPTIVIAKKHFDLLVLQNIIMESNSIGGVLPMNVIDQAATRLKPFPNLSSTTIPFDAMIASEYAKINQLDKALFYLERSKNDNPLIGYNDCIKTYVYLKMNRNDSAKYYMQKAWNKRPWASDVYKNALLVSMRDKNDKALKKIFYNVFIL